MGVFATRSPFRPNHIGLSCVKLLRVEPDEKLGLTLVVSGADMMDGTPVVDIKPYLPFADSIPEAVGGFAQDHTADNLQVDFPLQLQEKLPEAVVSALLGILSQDPRPHYQQDPTRVYGFPYAQWEVRFTVDERRVLHVVSVS